MGDTDPGFRAHGRAAGGPVVGHRPRVRPADGARPAPVPDRAAVYYAALLVNVGCHTDAHEQAHWFGDDIAMKATKYQYEPFSAADIAAMLRMLGRPI